MCANFQAKQTTLTFLAQICPKMYLGLETQKTNIGIRIRILEILCVQFSGKTDNFDSLAQICPQMDLELEIQKINIRIRISIIKILCVLIFRLNRQL